MWVKEDANRVKKVLTLIAVRGIHTEEAACNLRGVNGI